MAGTRWRSEKTQNASEHYVNKQSGAETETAPSQHCAQTEKNSEGFWEVNELSLNNTQDSSWQRLDHTVIKIDLLNFGAEDHDEYFDVPAFIMVSIYDISLLGMLPPLPPREAFQPLGPEPTVFPRSLPWTLSSPITRCLIWPLRTVYPKKI